MAKRCEHKNGCLVEHMEAAHEREVKNGQMEELGVSTVGNITGYSFRCYDCKKIFSITKTSPKWLKKNIKSIMNQYNFSKDYELLWELVKNSNFVAVGFIQEKSELSDKILETVVKVKWSKIEKGAFIYMGSPILQYNSAGERGIKGFIETCRKYNLKFILPSSKREVKLL